MILKNVSGYGGNQTYHITRIVDKNITAEIAFHLVGEKGNFKNQPMSLDIQKSATIAFSSAKLCPERLTEMEDKFFINQWLKNSKGLDKNMKDLNVDLAKKIGRLIARIHLIDMQWYTPHYEKLVEKYLLGFLYF